MRPWLVLLSALALAGCTAVATDPRPAAYFEDEIAVGTPSLIPGAQGTLTDADIERILQHRYKPPALSRVALLSDGWSSWGAWSDDLALVTEDIDEGTIARLEDSAMVYDAAFLPSMLVPEQRSIAGLREAAARFQADLLLVYRVDCRTFRKFRLLFAHKARSRCVVETVLLDVRTGLVPFAIASSRVFDTEETDADLNFTETQLRSQLKAISEAMGEIAQAVVAFLEAR